jgi:sugar phosphate isomerase/epimerase
MLHAARYERMFPGEGGIDLGSLTRAMPADITVSIEVPTTELAETMDAKARAQRALTAARNVIAGSRDPRSCCT